MRNNGRVYFTGHDKTSVKCAIGSDWQPRVSNSFNSVLRGGGIVYAKPKTTPTGWNDHIWQTRRTNRIRFSSPESSRRVWASFMPALVKPGVGKMRFIKRCITLGVGGEGVNRCFVLTHLWFSSLVRTRRTSSGVTGSKQTRRFRNHTNDVPVQIKRLSAALTLCRVVLHGFPITLI